jgi:nitronate monooxygenase
LCQVQSIESLRVALAAGTDVVVAQGNEACGHAGQLGTLPFLAQALSSRGRRWSSHPAESRAPERWPPAVKAPGSVRRCWPRMKQSRSRTAIKVADSYKKCIVESDGQDTVFTPVYDILYDQRFPDGIAGRTRINKFTREWHGRETEVSQRRDELAALAPFWPPIQRDPEIHPIWMGQSAGSVHGVRSGSRGYRRTVRRSRASSARTIACPPLARGSDERVSRLFGSPALGPLAGRCLR